MLERVTARAARLGLGRRVETRLTDIPDGLTTLGRADLVWMSMALHHVGDETAALGQIRSLLNPGGLLAVVEREGALRVLPAEETLGRPGIWERVETAWSAWFAEMRADLPDATTSADYPTMLRRAGFELVADEVLNVVVDAPLDDRARRFAHRHLVRTRELLGDQCRAGGPGGPRHAHRRGRRRRPDAPRRRHPPRDASPVRGAAPVRLSGSRAGRRGDSIDTAHETGPEGRSRVNLRLLRRFLFGDRRRPSLPALDAVSRLLDEVVREVGQGASGGDLVADRRYLRIVGIADAPGRRRSIRRGHRRGWRRLASACPRW